MSTIKMNEFERNKLNEFQDNSIKKFDYSKYNIEDIFDSLNLKNAIEKNIYRKLIDTCVENTTKINELNDSIKRRDNFINKCCLFMSACVIVTTILTVIEFVGA